LPPKIDPPPLALAALRPMPMRSLDCADRRAKDVGRPAGFDFDAGPASVVLVRSAVARASFPVIALFPS